MNSEKETKAFLTVIEDHKGIIYKVASSYCKNQDDRKDLIQEIIIQLWRSFGNYNSQYKWSTWIYRIALNVSISFYRKEKRRAKIVHPISDSIIYLQEEQVQEKDPNLQQLQVFISELKELDRALILLFLEGNSHKEISTILGLSETNVSTKVARIKNKLKQRFSSLKES